MPKGAVPNRNGPFRHDFHTSAGGQILIGGQADEGAHVSQDGQIRSK
jgi:hypothetical protein